MHHLPREILCDGESDHVLGGSCVGDDPAYLSTGEPAGLYAQPQHDFVAVDGVNVEMDRHPCAARGGQEAQQRLAGLAEFIRAEGVDAPRAMLG
jgi:hypothetical protein